MFKNKFAGCAVRTVSKTFKNARGVPLERARGFFIAIGIGIDINLVFFNPSIAISIPIPIPIFNLEP